MSGLKIKVSHHFKNWPLLDQTPGKSGLFAGNQFLVTSEPVACDVWVVFDGLFEKECAICPPEQTIFVVGEPPTIRRYPKGFLNQFQAVIGCANYPHPRVVLRQQGQPWYAGESYDALFPPLSTKKSKEMAIFTSGRQFTKYQKLRHRFYEKVKQRFGSRVDVYGTGVGSFCSKAQILNDYRYSFAIENTVCDHYMTEKMPDCFLSECFPFYFGAQNVTEYFPKNCFQRIDIEKPEESLDLIRMILDDEGHYGRHLETIRQAKRDYLTKIQFFGMISATVRELKFMEGLVAVENQLLPQKYFGMQKIKTEIKDILRKKVFLIYVPHRQK